MNLEVLKTRNPHIFCAAGAEGIAQERDRVAAHVDLYKKTGDMQTAIDAIKRGATMTPEIFARYMSAGRNRADVQARIEDEEAVEAALANVKQPSSSPVDSFRGAVADRFFELVGTDAGEVEAFGVQP